MRLRKQIIEHKGQPYRGSDQTFLTVCEKTAINPTTRQYSKWRNHRGTAYKRRLVGVMA